MGSSTGNMLVDNKNVLEEIFAKSPMLIAVHCEDERIIKENIAKAKAQYGEEVSMSEHPKTAPILAHAKTAMLSFFIV